MKDFQSGLASGCLAQFRSAVGDQEIVRFAGPDAEVSWCLPLVRLLFFGAQAGPHARRALIWDALQACPDLFKIQLQRPLETQGLLRDACLFLAAAGSPLA